MVVQMGRHVLAQSPCGNLMRYSAAQHCCVRQKKLIGFRLHGESLHVFQHKDSTVVGVFLKQIFHVAQRKGKDVNKTIKTYLGPSNMAITKFSSGASSLSGEAARMRIHVIH